MGRSRTRLPRKGWSASSRPSRSCRTSACCRFRACATGSARWQVRAGCGAGARRALGLHHGRSKDGRRNWPQASRRLCGQSQAGRATGKTRWHLWARVAHLPLSDEATAFIAAPLPRSRRKAQFLSRPPSPALALPTCGRRPCRARNMTRAASSHCLTTRQISRAARTRRRDQDLRGVCGRDQGRGSVRADGGPPLHVASRGVQCLPCRPDEPAHMSAFIALRERHLSIFNEVFARRRLDAAIFPQMREQLGA